MEPYVVPDYVEPVAAWRTWRLLESDDEPLLHSVVFDVAWRPGVPLEASCMKRSFFARRRHRGEPLAAPREQCECGIYAADLSTAASYIGVNRVRGLADVVGQVRLWGTVVECERGWRGAVAYPASLYLLRTHGGRRAMARTDVLRALLDYGVPVFDVPEPYGRRLPEIIAAAQRRVGSLAENEDRGYRAV